MIKNFLINLVKLYQFLISPLFGHSCRFFPSCSSYMIDSIKIHGIFKGLYLGTKRILKCNPFFKGGVDYPDKK
jgi:putative membrane protein insertion efficiency factor